MKIFSLAFLLLFLYPFVFPITDSEQKLNKNNPGVANIVFKSTDGGQSWQDISEGLPENLWEDSIRGNSFFANDKGLFLRVGSELYHSTANATAPFWTKEIFPGEHSSIALGKSGISANNYWGINLKKTNGSTQAGSKKINLRLNKTR